MSDGYLVDSNILMRFFKKNNEEIELLNSLRKRGILAISELSIFELQAGWSEKQTEDLFPRLFDLVVTKSLSLDILCYAGTLRRNYKEQGVTLHAIDTLIAATAIKNDMWMVTHNRKDFEPIKELKLYQALFSQ